MTRVSDADAFAVVARRVAAGEPIDTRHGRPGEDLVGASVTIKLPGDEEFRRSYERGQADYDEALTAGRFEPLPMVAPAGPAAIRAAEEAVGFPLPALLCRLLTEVANGGFGPGYGVLGVDGGFAGGGGPGTPASSTSRG